MEGRPLGQAGNPFPFSLLTQANQYLALTGNTASANALYVLRAEATTPATCSTVPRLPLRRSQTRIYAANGAGSGSIQVFNSSFAPVSLLPSAFTDPTL